MKKRTKILIVILAIVFAALAVCTGIYTNDYYRAVNVSAGFEKSNGVTVTKIKEGWFFDGPAEDKALLFYAGAKVEETAYAPLMKSLSEKGIDCFLLKAPIKLPFFSVSKAESVMKRYSYENYYLGGHSLGGLVAANDAAKHPRYFSGLFLLAAYPTEDLTAADFPVVFIYGTNDGVLNRERLERGFTLVPEDYKTYKIEGGNHSGFASYGEQKGDNKATVSAKEQQEFTAKIILKTINEENRRDL